VYRDDAQGWWMFKILIEFVSAVACVLECGSEPSGPIDGWEFLD